MTKNNSTKNLYITSFGFFLEITSTIRLNQSGTQNKKSDKINLLSYYMYYVSMKFEFSLLLIFICCLTSLMY